MCRRMLRASGVVFVLALVSLNILSVTSQRTISGRLSTSVRGGDKPRWIPRSIPTPSSSTTEATSTEADDSDGSTRTPRPVSGLFGLKNKVVVVENEKEDVLPATKPVEIAPSSSSSSDEVDEKPKDITPTTSSTEEQPKVVDVDKKEPETGSEEVVLVEATRKVRQDEQQQQPERKRENLKDATKESSSSSAVSGAENEKVPTKRDLPFVIQSSPGIVNRVPFRKRSKSVASVFYCNALSLAHGSPVKSP